jgi:two-component system, cell cycle response regulator DivK
MDVGVLRDTPSTNSALEEVSKKMYQSQVHTVACPMHMKSSSLGRANVKRIALVEDNMDNRTQISVLLEDEFDVVEFANGDDAVNGVVDASPDLVLLDISARKQNGTDVLKHLRSDPRTTGLPIIALSAHTMVGDRVHYLSLGFDGYISKPIVDEQALLDEIDELLQTKDRAKEHGLVAAPGAAAPRESSQRVEDQPDGIAHTKRRPWNGHCGSSTL